MPMIVSHDILLTVRADKDLLALLARLISIGQQIVTKDTKIMSTLQDVVDEVAAETTAIGSLTAFIQGLEAQIAALPGLTPAQQAQIDAIFANVGSNTAAINVAMVINVPPATPPVVVPPVV